MKIWMIAGLMAFGGGVGATEANCPLGDFNRCRQATSCSSFYICQVNDLINLNAFIAKAVTELGGLESVTDCRRIRDLLEDDILAHSTTIECVDTVTGPEFSG